NDLISDVDDDRVGDDSDNHNGDVDDDHVGDNNDDHVVEDNDDHVGDDFDNLSVTLMTTVSVTISTIMSVTIVTIMSDCDVDTNVLEDSDDCDFTVILVILLTTVIMMAIMVVIFMVVSKNYDNNNEVAATSINNDKYREFFISLSQFLQASKPTDYTVRSNFALEMLQQENYDFLDCVVFSDESTFHFSGKVNTHNVRIWESENPHEFVQSERNFPKLNGFCALSQRKVYVCRVTNGAHIEHL
ncbi:hypothetical protein ANN_08175, partial [Periplaneta americana]